MLTTRDLLAGAVDIRANLGGVLDTVHLCSLLVAPPVQEAAAAGDGGGSGGGRQPAITPCLRMAPGVVCLQCQGTPAVHTRAHSICVIASAAGAFTYVGTETYGAL